MATFDQKTSTCESSKPEAIMTSCQLESSNEHWNLNQNTNLLFQGDVFNSVPSKMEVVFFYLGALMARSYAKGLWWCTKLFARIITETAAQLRSVLSGDNNGHAYIWPWQQGIIITMIMITITTTIIIMIMIMMIRTKWYCCCCCCCCCVFM